MDNTTNKPETIEEAAERIIQRERGKPFHGEIACFELGSRYAAAKEREAIVELLEKRRNLFKEVDPRALFELIKELNTLIIQIKSLSTKQ